MDKASVRYKIYYWKDSLGKSPFLKWLEDLRDVTARARIRVRLDRLERDHLGDCRSVGSGVHELRMDFGPGYRVYWGILKREIIVIFEGGTKRTQDQDIESAKNRRMQLKEKP